MHPDRRLALGLFAVSAAYLAGASAIAAPEGGYATVGPRAFPLAIGIGLAAVALRIGLRTGPRSDPSTATATTAAITTRTRTGAEGDSAPPSADGEQQQATATTAATTTRTRTGASNSSSTTTAATAAADGTTTTAATAAADGTTTTAGATTTPADWRAAGPSAVCFLLYALLLEPAGYLPATTAFIAVEARLLGSRRWRRDLAASAAVAASVYVLFGSLLGIRLPPGILGGW